MDRIDTCVIGAGVVGLAIAKKLAGASEETLILDRELRYGEGVSSRNSEVIHAGIYYPQGSLKAMSCVDGKHRLYEYCAARGVGHRRCGKLIVATESAEEATLEGIVARAEANGVMDLEVWNGARVAREEPAVKATMALFSPSTGIVSAAELMSSYLGEAEAQGGMFVARSEVSRIVIEADGFVVSAVTDGEVFEFRCNRLINSAGLGAQGVALNMEGLDPALVPPLHLCKGNYFVMQGKNPFNHLIYPVPHPSGAGLGVHATIDLGGQVKFGPDVEYIPEEDFNVSEDRLDDYYEAVRRYFPSLQPGSLSPGYVGIRPKLQGPGDAPVDFVIQGQEEHGIPGLIQLYGIESPGLTSSLAIAEDVADRLRDSF
jgi:L-2-hydroxyglutarate oxidase LhgO